MEDNVKKIIVITNELLDPNSSLKDMALVEKLRELEKLLTAIEESGRWQEIDFSYNDRWWTTKVVKSGELCRKRRTIEQFYRQFGMIPLKEFLSKLKESFESYLRKNYNIT